MENVLNFFKIDDTILTIEDKKAQERLDALSNSSFSGNYNDLSNKPTIEYESSTLTISFKNF